MSGTRVVFEVDLPIDSPSRAVPNARDLVANSRGGKIRVFHLNGWGQPDGEPVVEVKNEGEPDVLAFADRTELFAMVREATRRRITGDPQEEKPFGPGGEPTFEAWLSSMLDRIETAPVGGVVRDGKIPLSLDGREYRVEPEWSMTREALDALDGRERAGDPGIIVRFWKVGTGIDPLKPELLDVNRAHVVRGPYHVETIFPGPF